MLKWAKKHPSLTTLFCAGLLTAVLFIVSIFVPIIRDLCSYNEHGQAEQCAQHHLGPLALFWLTTQADTHNGLVTAISTALLTGITYMLVRLGREQSKTTRAQLRAYVMVGTADVFDIAGDRMPKCKIQIKNYGQTPAYNLNAGISMGFVEWPFKNVDWPTFDFAGDKRSERPIAPGDDFPLLHDLGKALDPNEVAAIYGGRRALFIAGKVIYNDAFGEPHETEFCFFTTKIVSVGTLAAVDDRNKST